MASMSDWKSENDGSIPSLGSRKWKSAAFRSLMARIPVLEAGGIGSSPVERISLVCKESFSSLAAKTSVLETEKREFESHLEHNALY